MEPEHGDGGGGGLDRKDVDVWENQVYFTMSGWGKPGVTSSRGPFTDKEGTEKRTMDGLDEDVKDLFYRANYDIMMNYDSSAAVAAA